MFNTRTQECGNMHVWNYANTKTNCVHRDHKSDQLRYVRITLMYLSVRVRGFVTVGYTPYVPMKHVIELLTLLGRVTQHKTLILFPK